MKIKSTIEKYHAKNYFESWHKSIFNQEFSDRVTISPTTNKLISNYHYGLLELKINEFLILNETDLEHEALLDIGSGAGHWIDFLNSSLQIQKTVGVEISEICVDALKRKYKEQSNVEIHRIDFSKKDIKLNMEFDIISAIGVMFHIVDDIEWEYAIANIGNNLKENGIAFVGGEFGNKTENRQFNKTNNFSSWQERQDEWNKFKNEVDETVFVNKRVRSLKDWEKSLKRNGMKIVELLKSRPNEGIKTPENNLLVIKNN